MLLCVMVQNAQYLHAVCHYAKCRYAECRGTNKRLKRNFTDKTQLRTNSLYSFQYLGKDNNRTCTTERITLVIHSAAL
jgi:hypothetical protein